jgi:hypothetical protein
LDQIFFCFRSIFTSFSARHWASLRESFYFTLDFPMCAMHNCCCVRRRGPSPFHFGLDTIPLAVALCDPAPLG